MSTSRNTQTYRTVILLILIASLLFVTSLLPAGLFAQDASTGALRGTVLDPDGGLIQGADMSSTAKCPLASVAAV